MELEQSYHIIQEYMELTCPNLLPLLTILFIYTLDPNGDFIFYYLIYALNFAPPKTKKMISILVSHGNLEENLMNGQNERIMRIRFTMEKERKGNVVRK